MSPRDRSRSLAGRVFLIIAALVCIAGSAGYGQESSARTPRNEPPGTRLPPRSGKVEPAAGSRSGGAAGNGLWITVISLTAIVGSLGLVGYWLRPYLGVPRGLPLEALELLGRRAIEQKVAIHLVRCGGKVLVVGVSPEGARTLSEITDPVEVQRMVETCRAPREARPFPTPVSDLAGMSRNPNTGGPDPIGAPAAGLRTPTRRIQTFANEDTRRG